MLNLCARIVTCSVIACIFCDFSLSANEQAPSEPLSESAGTRSLNDFVHSILAVHPEMAAARAALEEAEAHERAANRPIYNPELLFDAQDSADKTVQVGIFQSVDWSGKKKAAFEASSARRLSAEVAAHVIHHELSAKILTFLSDYWAAVEFARLASASSDLMHDFSQQAKVRYEAGDMTQVEYETAVMAYAEVRIRQADVIARLAEVIRELTTQGAPENIRLWPRMPETLPILSIQPADIEPRIESLAEVKAANALVTAATADVNLAKRLKKPDPTFGIRFGEEDDERLIGLSFSIPLYVRNNFDEEVLASIAARSRAQADAAAITQDARARLLVAMERYSTKRTAWIVWEEAGASSIERRAEALQRLWNAREINLSEFLLQVRQTLETRNTVLELRASLWSSWIEYLEASEQLEQWLTNSYPSPQEPIEQTTMRGN